MIEFRKEKGTGLYSVWNTDDFDNVFRYATVGKVKDLVEKGIISKKVVIGNEEKWMVIRESNNEMIIFDTPRDAKKYYCKLRL